MLETRLPRLDASVQTVAARSAYRGDPWIKKKTTKTWLRKNGGQITFLANSPLRRPAIS